MAKAEAQSHRAAALQQELDKLTTDKARSVASRPARDRVNSLLLAWYNLQPSLASRFLHCGGLGRGTGPSTEGCSAAPKD